MFSISVVYLQLLVDLKAKCSISGLISQVGLIFLLV